MSICNRCESAFILDKRAMKFVKPYCPDCIKVKKDDTHNKILEFLEENTPLLDDA